MSNAEFLEAAVKLDGVSISDEGEEFVATCEEEAEGKIDATKVFASARSAGLDVTNTIGDFDAGHLRVYVDKEGSE
ncbi:hypothetical protein [Halalkalicoccus jeotgali]|uniref:Uncharacterized protein n=1 Tax=Halalkalicoccus jeotgali (strain DSM 18796 / CECT 7217 / JCM 14584 / KCTC 4019 / B3) TaxID=795797 RepID=D8J9L7_HALJB|nr:hypothetical protein [Halalkalicoccus jeotgali]ADJ14429.1 hypothetical protein HacjB3_05190 [Halalkalicoccus jeotgali B3]ELY40145.1 hypothetical protein C497_03575 [Halalkalicoccus jeotgali B3]